MKAILAGVLLFLLLMTPVSSVIAAPQEKVVAVVPVEGTIDPGLARYMERAYQEAENLGADAVLIEMNTPGGRLDAAVDIKETIKASPLVTVCYVSGGAISAGSFLALLSEHLIMAPGTTIGDAEPRVGMQKADEKVISYWTGEMRAAAELQGRDPQLAAAMADRDVEIPGIIARGKLLTLTDREAEDLGLIDGRAETREEALNLSGLDAFEIVEIPFQPAETLARWVTNPYIGSLLLILGMAGFLIELFSPGLGLPGGIGIICLGLYFGGHIIAGLAGWEVFLLLAAGIVLVALEIFVFTGFGVAGLLGLAALASAILVASPSLEEGLVSLFIAAVGTVVLLLLSFKFLPTRTAWNRLILKTSQESQAGYVPTSHQQSGYLRQKGSTLTPLRPAGTVRLANGELVDVVSETGFVQANTPVEVVKVEGARVVVRELKK